VIANATADESFFAVEQISGQVLQMQDNFMLNYQIFPSELINVGNG